MPEVEKTSKIKRPKILGLKQLLQKKYSFLEGLTEKFSRSFGSLTNNFIMTVWGDSGNGKSNFIMQLLTELMKYGDVLYVSLEEGTESTMQLMALRHLSEESHSGKIKFADNTMNYDGLMWTLKRKKQAQFVVIDSVQYLDINYEKYKRLKEAFPKKSFVFISHANGKNPDGRTANKVRYDSGIKVYVEKYIAFIQCRYGGNKPFVIWAEGAEEYWGAKELKKIINGRAKKMPKEKLKPDTAIEDSPAI